MPTTVTENWSGRKYQPNKTAQRVFVVTYDSTEVLTATELSAIGATVTYVLAGFPGEPALLPQTPTAERVGPITFQVTWPFKPSPTDLGGDPLLLPATYSNDVGSFTDICEYDIDGNAKVNSAADPFDPPPNREFSFEILVVKKYVTLPDGFAMLKAFQDTCNSDTINIPILPDPVEPGQMKCVIVKPEEEIDATMSKVRAIVLFHIRKGRHRDSAGIWDSWKTRHLDQGYMGFNQAAKKDLFYTKQGNLPSRPILLNGVGVPLVPPNSGVTVGSDIPLENPEPPSLADTVDLGGDAGVFLVYQDLEAVAYASMGIF